MAGQAGFGRAGKATHGWRQPAWSLAVLALGLALSACGLQGLKNPAPASTSGSTTTPASVLAQFVGGVAGAGTSDGNAQVSRFAYAQGVANDGHGRVYVADTGNHTIRMMTSSGTGSSTVWTTVTIAGVAGTSGYTDTTTDSSGLPVANSKPALFNNPIGLAIDASAAAGSIAGTILYVADFGNNTIRKIVLKAPASGTTPVAVVSTIAGVPQVVGNVLGVGSVAEFNGPVGLALNTARQELYVTDWGNDELRRINLAPSTSNPCDIAPTNTPSATVPALYEPLYNVSLLAGHGAATNSTGGTDVSSGSVDGSAGLAGFAGPQGIVVDGSGVIYVTDTKSNLIRKVVIAKYLDTSTTPATSKDTCGNSSYGVVTTLSGVKSTVGGADDDFFTTTVTTLTYNSTDPTIPNAVQRKVDVTKTMGTLAHPGASTVQPSVITYQYNQSGTQVGTVQTSTSVTPSTPKYNNPTALVLDGKGNLLITDSDNDVIRQYDMSTNVVSTVVGIPPTTVQVGAGMELVTYPGTANTDVSKGIKAQVNHPRSITYDSSVGSSGSLFLADSGNSRIRQISDDGSWTASTIGGSSTGYTDGTSTAAGFNGPRGIGFDAAGNAYVADSGNNSIRKIDSSGNVTTLAGLSGDVGGFFNGSGTVARFNSPSGLVVDAGTGIIYVADTANNSIRMVDSTGAVSTLAGSPSQAAGGADSSSGSGATFRAPTGLALDGQGHLYVADSGNNTIRRITLASPYPVLTIAGVALSSGSVDSKDGTALFNNPQGVVASGSVLYVADTDNETIRKISLPPTVTVGSGVVTTVAGTVQVAGSADSVKNLAASTTAYYPAQFNKPTALILDGSGNIFVADHDNQTLREVVPGATTTDSVVTTVAGLAGASGFIAGNTPGLLAFPAGLAVKGSTLYITISDSVVTMSNLP